MFLNNGGGIDKEGSRVVGEAIPITFGIDCKESCFICIYWGQKGIIQLICIELYRYVVSSKEEVLNHKHLENWKSMRYLANYFLVTRLTEEVGDVIEQKVLNKMLQGGKKGLDHVASCKAKGSK